MLVFPDNILKRLWINVAKHASKQTGITGKQPKQTWESIGCYLKWIFIVNTFAAGNTRMYKELGLKQVRYSLDQKLRSGSDSLHDRKYGGE